MSSYATADQLAAVANKRRFATVQPPAINGVELGSFKLRTINGAEFAPIQAAMFKAQKAATEEDPEVAAALAFAPTIETLAAVVCDGDGEPLWSESSKSSIADLPAGLIAWLYEQADAHCDIENSANLEKAAKNSEGAGDSSPTG